MAKSKTNEWALALLRAVLGIIFLYHGYMKLFVAGTLPGTAAFFAQIGIPFANVSAVAVAFAEFAGGIFLLFGMATKWTAVVLIVEMLVAFFKVHFKQGFFISAKAYGYEYALLILAALVVVLVNGAGKLSLGKLFKSRHLK